jgi:hypothetical protein
MQIRYRIYTFLFVVVFMSNWSRAQGTLEATLSTTWSGLPLLSGSVIVDTPATNSTDLYFPVLFQVTIITNDPIFTAGRIGGPHTAWAFDLGTPSSQDGSLVYTGTTGMEAFQIADMLANSADFEVYAYSPSGPVIGQLAGPLVTVPEPSIAYLLLIGLGVIIVLKCWHYTPPNTALEATPHSHCGFASEFSGCLIRWVRGASAFVR